MVICDLCDKEVEEVSPFLWRASSVALACEACINETVNEVMEENNKIMKTGIELIEEERQEQINKHGFSIEHDREYYKDGQLFQAASFCAELKSLDGEQPATMLFSWLADWETDFEEKIRNKSRIGQLIVAGALMMAENERLGAPVYLREIESWAAEIDRLQKE